MMPPWAGCFSWLQSAWRSYRRSRHGAAAAEFAIILPILVVPILNVVDLGSYAYDRMQLDNAAQVAAQAAWSTCGSQGKVPATVNNNCSGLSSAMTAALQSTALGSAVTITSTSENFYCLNSSGTLVTVGSFPNTEPADCSSVGSASDIPGDYILITASYTYSPLFSAISVASLLTTPITRTAYMRLD